MTCLHFTDRGKTVFLCVPGPTERHRTQTQRSAKPCRGCKRRTVQTLVLLVEVEPSYYEPQCVWECACGEDNR